MKRLRSVVLVAITAIVFVGNAEAQLGSQQGLLDPNIASEKDLLALPHLNATIVKGMMERRPFLKMADLNAFLRPALKKEQLAELYAKLFVHLNLNSATEEEIMMIPGVGKRLAHEFEEYRPFKSLAQFRKEIGKYVNEEEVARLEQYVFVPVKLNTASDDDILSIPGVGAKMLHEFKEYRPYKSLEQFRREIGKYVDKKELARLETYVALEGD